MTEQASAGKRFGEHYCNRSCTSTASCHARAVQRRLELRTEINKWGWDTESRRKILIGITAWRYITTSMRQPRTITHKSLLLSKSAFIRQAKTANSRLNFGPANKRLEDQFLDGLADQELHRCLILSHPLSLDDDIRSAVEYPARHRQTQPCQRSSTS